MGSGGPGNIVHIENLYVKPRKVKDNVNILLGKFVVEDSGARELSTGDVADGSFVSQDAFQVSQAGENANNLTTTDPLIKKDLISLITKGSDWTCKMAPGVIPEQTVGIKRIDSQASVFVMDATDVASEILGVYKHREYSTIAETSLEEDDGVIQISR